MDFFPTGIVGFFESFKFEWEFCHNAVIIIFKLIKGGKTNKLYGVSNKKAKGMLLLKCRGSTYIFFSLLIYTSDAV